MGASTEPAQPTEPVVVLLRGTCIDGAEHALYLVERYRGQAGYRIDGFNVGDDIRVKVWSDSKWDEHTDVPEQEVWCSVCNLSVPFLPDEVKIDWN